MIKKLKILAVFICLSLTLGLMSNTYSRYIADATGDLKVEFAKWEIKINTEDITNSENTTVKITPTMMQNANISNTAVAPSSEGYFDIAVDPTNVDVSFNYSVTLELLNNNMPDIMISKYAIFDSTFNGEDDTLTKTIINDGVISNTINYGDITKGTIADNKYNFNSFTIRVYFKWFEGTDGLTNETMNDVDDTAIGIDAAANDTKLQIQASLHFEQKLS